MIRRSDTVPVLSRPGPEGGISAVGADGNALHMLADDGADKYLSLNMDQKLTCGWTCTLE